MKSWLRGLDRSAVLVAFGAMYALLCIMAMFPPLYLTTSGIRAAVLGLPWTVIYWIGNGLLIFLTTWALCWVEGVRGELDTDMEDTDLVPTTPSEG